MVEEEDILPVYLVVEESAAMAPVLPRLHRVLTSMLQWLRDPDTIVTNPLVSVLVFSDVSTELVSLIAPEEIQPLPPFSLREEAALYGVAMSDLRARIDRDVSTLLGDGYSVRSPAVLLFCAGEVVNEDSWQTPTSALHDSGWTHRPRVVAFGFGRADMQLIRALSSNPEWGRLRDATDEADLGHDLRVVLEGLSWFNEFREGFEPGPTFPAINLEGFDSDDWG
jgi:uncharacterized protein YegL